MRSFIPVLVLAGAVATACGPIESTALINEADVAIGTARAAEAEQYAPYEITSAELYLEKAREERGYAEFGQAVDYARKANDMARQAHEKAVRRIREGDGPSQTGEELVPFEEEQAPTEKIEIVPAP